MVKFTSLYTLFQENALYIKKDSFLFEQENMSLFIFIQYFFKQ